MRDQVAPLAATESKRHLAAEIPSTGLLISLHLPDPLTDTVALGLGEGGGDRQEQLGQF
jgi:hypothetical protein